MSPAEFRLVVEQMGGPTNAAREIGCLSLSSIRSYSLGLSRIPQRVIDRLKELQEAGLRRQARRSTYARNESPDKMPFLIEVNGEVVYRNEPLLELERLIERCGGLTSAARYFRCAVSSLARYQRGERVPPYRIRMAIERVIERYGQAGPIPRIGAASETVRAFYKRTDSP